MIKNYLTTAYRNMKRNKVYACINIFGLGIGMGACLIIFSFIAYEWSVDAFHTRSDRLYRLNEVQTFPGMSAQHVALSMYPMAPTMKDEFPEIEAYARIVGGGDIVEVGDEQFLFDNFVWTDSMFFDLFDFEWVRGDIGRALTEPGQAVLTESVARTLFGDGEAIGKSFTKGDEVLIVAGIMKDTPPTSHLQLDGLGSLATIENEQMLSNWGSNWLNTYFLLQPGANPAAIEDKFREYQTKYMRENAEDYYELYLQPFSEIHLGSTHITHDYRNYKKFDGSYIGVFLLLGIFVLLIACINFMNLSTARGAARSKEVGIRKAVGAQKTQLVTQFIGESVLFAVLSFVIGIVLAVLLIPVINSMLDRSLTIGFLLDPLLLIELFSLVLLIGFAAGLYPAFYLSAFRPIQVLKGKVESLMGRSRFTLRSTLVVVQFALSIILIVGTLLTLRQLDYMRSRNLGFDKEQVVLVGLNNTANEKYDVFKSELLSNPAVSNVTASYQRLGNNIHQMGLRAEGDNEIRQLAISHLSVDYNYLSFYGIELLDGRAFSKDFSTDAGQAFVVNEALAREMNWDDPVGKRMAFGSRDSMGTVVGLVGNFNYNSLHHKVEPLAMSVQDFGYSELSVRISSDEMQAGLKHIEQVWNELVPDRPFEYTFLDDHFSDLYESDRQVSQVVGLLALLAVFIACLGLFGLASITADHRIKEMGIRKVMGAGVAQLTVLMIRGFVGLVFVAFIVASPISYFLMQRWLESFAFHIDMDAGIFIYAGLLAITIAILTVGHRAISTARANPVHALRYE